MVEFPEGIRASAARRSEFDPMQDGSAQIRVDIRVPVGCRYRSGRVRQAVRGCGFLRRGDPRPSPQRQGRLRGSRPGRLQYRSDSPLPGYLQHRHAPPAGARGLGQLLEEIAPGRTFLTLAPGFLSVESAGKRRASLEKLREDTTTVRRLLAAETVYSDGKPMRLRNRPEHPLPVLLTASGPRFLELAGEVADGALMLVGLHPDSVAAARERLAAGASRTGRDPEQLREIFIVPVAIGAREEVRGGRVAGSGRDRGGSSIQAAQTFTGSKRRA